jgi:LDH2 family malate/lactate/ureidoglycolate dehydrogenase
LRGVDSHGVARLSGYIRLWEAKRINSCYANLCTLTLGNENA